MKEISVLIGGKAGDGINSAGMVVAHLFNRMGYRVYMYFDYPSLIKGGHNFAIVRASRDRIGTHRDRVDFILALNQDSVDFHKDLCREDTEILYDSSRVRAEGIGVNIPEILKAEQAPAVMGNSCLIGAFARAAGIEWEVLEAVFERQIPKALAKNLNIARRGFDEARECCRIEPLGSLPLPVISGNEAIGLGLLHGGLDAYVAYPMTPTSNILHFMAEVAETHDLLVFHPENEIAVILMALGLGYAGKKTAVGTSGGGFCLMTEGLSLSGMSEIPVVVVLGQRTGPSTGLPTYTAQSDLHFALHAGQGEFPRLVAAPGDAEQAFLWSSLLLQLAWKYQTPAIILCDKTLCEGFYSFNNPDATIPLIPANPPGIPGPGYLRYELSADGVSGMLFPPARETVIKVNGYTHDQAGITTEKADLASLMSEKRQRKGAALEEEMARLRPVEIGGEAGSDVALICWGSTVGVCREVAAGMGLLLVQPILLSPLPDREVKDALKGVKRLIAVEENSEGQLAMLLARYGIRVDAHIHRYDGRPFALEELEARVRGVLS
ncbi:MAG: 2-oxoacid:acceptor oxidoreductase subunit alpha [Methanolinea sp.]|jgi:2-oxoglutarate ferredoxin oxidoreductase subunit alpha|nr:2-oxoacid:acceptor oxidoreductase subunit alpha [Methanolinea sp.]